jgi:hypothetical protein
LTGARPLPAATLHPPAHVLWYKRPVARTRAIQPEGENMQTFLKVVFALAALWSISACTQSLNEMNVSIESGRKSAIGR